MELRQFITGDNLTSEEADFNNHMNQIAIAFSEGRIAAMVGTGFSRNAKINSKTKDDESLIPLWPEVGKYLMNELKIDIPKEGVCFEDPIRLASLYVAAKDEDELDDFLEKIINDKKYEPDNVHKKFVELNWNDIFTTNYDTLIERADAKGQKKYSVVTNDKSFPLSSKPRIIKLHGSFDSEGHFIMTQEQYRKYPKEHQIFVNSVQQSFIENTIVLFGFSGTDPNFLEWTGWIRDNLDIDNARKIYLTSVKPLSNSEKLYFKKNNITLLDFSIIKQKNPNISDAKIFENMFDYWSQYPNISSKIINFQKSKIDDWINNLWKPENSVEESVRKYGFEEFTQTITEKWQTERESYPKNIILPQNYNNQLFWKTRDVVETFGVLKNIENNEQSINFLYEFDWRWNLCNIPHFTDTIEAYKTALGYTDNKKEIQINTFSPMVQKKAIKLLLSLYKSCREDGNQKLCKSIEEIILANRELLGANEKDLFQYEKILNAFSELDYKSLLNLINNWELSSDSIIWSIKKAGLLAEIGEEIQAVKILKENLQIIKGKLDKDARNLEYSCLENLINWLLIWIINSKRFDKDFPSFEINEDELRERNKILSSYKCDVLDIVNSYSKDIYANKQKKLEKKEFDDVIKPQYIINSEEVPFASFIYINIFEKIGFPYRINNSSLADSEILYMAINNILGYQPDWALNLIIRSYEETCVEKNIGFEELRKLSKDCISEFVCLIINSFVQLQDDLSLGTDFAAKKFCNRLIKTYPELLSRFCFKVNSETKDKLISFLISIIEKDLVCRIPNIKKFIKRFINNFTLKDKEKIIPQLVCLKAPNYRRKDENRNINPLLYLYPHNESEIKISKFDINQQDISTLIERYSVEENSYYKKWYLTSLITISMWNLFDKKNRKLFGKKLWEKDLDDYHLPLLNGFHKSTILQLPHPDNINVKALYSKMLSETKIPSITNNGVLIHPLNTTWYYNICRPYESDVYPIQFWENILCMIEEQWNKDSKYLKGIEDPFNSYINSAKEYFRYSALILKQMIVLNCSELNDSTSQFFKYRERIIHQINLYISSGIDCLEAKAALLLIDKNLENDIYSIFREKIASSERNDVIEVLNSITFLLSLKLRIFNIQKKKNLVNIIGEAIFWQSKGDLEDCLKAYASIVKMEQKLVSKGQLLIVSLGLANIRKTITNSEGPIDIKTIKIKAAASELAHEIHNYFTNRHEQIPEEIEKWKNIAFDEDEFVDIRNQWSND